MLRNRRPWGQGLVEFALILPALLMIVLSIIEGALLFQSYMAIQHAAREAARFAVTYQPPLTYSKEQGEMMQRGELPGPPAYPSETEVQWNARRVDLIKQRAAVQAMGIRILHPALTEDAFAGLYTQPGFFGVRVQGFPEHDVAAQYDHPSLPGLPVRIEVHYRWEALDPLIRAIVPGGVPIVGEAIMINEGIQVGMGAVAPPAFPPVATVVPPTSTPIGGPVGTPTTGPTPTLPPTLTPTPSPTPIGAYIVLEPRQERWLQEELPNTDVFVYNHPDPGPYSVYWTDNCGTERYVGFDLTTVGRSASHRMPAGFPYLSACGGIPPTDGRVYTCTLRTNLASMQVPVYVPPRRPDLVIRRLIVPPSLTGGGTFTIGVEIANTQSAMVSGTFDVDIYIDPSHSPVLKGQPGQGTAGGSSPKQWQVDLPANGTRIVNYVVVLPPIGNYTLWAQVDTSDRIDEESDENNISGPVDLRVPCSTMCDNFDVGGLASKWLLAPIGTATGSGQAIVQEQELSISGLGAGMGVGTDGKFFLLHQGPYSGNFQMTVKVTNYPRGTSGAKAGLMVYESIAPLPGGIYGYPYAAIEVRQSRSGPYLEVLQRSAQNDTPTNPCTNVAIPQSLFDGNDANGEGVWLRIVREGDTLTRSYSLDGEAWNTQACMEITLAGLANPAVPGIFMAPYEATGSGTYDDFELCPLGAINTNPDIRPKPPGLKECGNVLTNSDLEPAGDLAPWVAGTEPQAVVASSSYSCDADGRTSGINSGTFSMLFRCDQQHGWPYAPFHAWAYQDLTVPAFVSTTQDVNIEMNVSLYYVVPPPQPPAGPGGTVGRAEDELLVTVQDSNGGTLTTPVRVTTGAAAQRGRFLPFSTNLAALFPLSNYGDQTLRLRFEAPNPTDLGDSEFYIDQVRCDVCTTVREPAIVPGQAYRLGGHVLVMLAGQPTDMPGVDVWAMQLPDGTTPADQLDFQATYSIQDSTYSFYNIRPGTYRVYAEVWVSGSLYSATQTVTIGAGGTNTEVNLTLL